MKALRKSGLLVVAIFALPAAALAQENRIGRPSAKSRPVTRSVSVTHKPAPAAQPGRGAPVATTHVPARMANQDGPQSAAHNALAQPRVPAPGAQFAGNAAPATGWHSRKLSGERIKRPLRRDDGPAPPAPPDDEQPAPYARKPGALIRTEGLGYTIKAADDARLHVIEAGDKIVQEPDKAANLGATGAHIGPPDKLPPPTPRTGSASGRNAITPNTVISDENSGDADAHNRDQGGSPDDPNGHGRGNGP